MEELTKSGFAGAVRKREKQVWTERGEVPLSPDKIGFSVQQAGFVGASAISWGLTCSEGPIILLLLLFKRQTLRWFVG